ncbi:uncharacterized protein F5147DRAFT_651152 [Suillus discolor]|uniref:Uncharacterized protein n=1 Tax=Suillus discolor TaxID=1912936 RepID=A0A9P7JWM5_9AGAM|nr:uncharacterized protein F5147DRAFT_651152 [Suillus discolor]KAG2112051.1 hypothetical protein F5147DRAFT_651152 [Suillus discolor]
MLISHKQQADQTLSITFGSLLEATERPEEIRLESRYLESRTSHNPKPPFLTTGQITPEALHTWEMSCMQCFLHKKVKDNEKDLIIQDWYLNNQEEFNALSFKEHIVEHPFNEWAVDIQSQNILLQETTSHLNNINLLYYLESHMNPELATDYHVEGITEINLRRWIEKAEECLSEHSNEDEHNSNNKTFVRLPSLSENERQLLHDNNGYFKHCEPFTSHTSSVCLKGFPDGMSHKILMSATITARKFKKDDKVVASVGVNKVMESTVAVMMPSVALGNDTDSGEESSLVLIGEELVEELVA